ncbi:hypothetical protein MYP_4228 [Sporocytophaga myxococcoides]|uniref:Uncharacterized protein n=1 Tax=Sporocytophaga myxococcoides TaxID=153721 RepID=A0A098LLI3_9BACT|nr:hypothetical protein MYP_4228 [Sporocytophaga myxococcoides]
MSENFKGLSSAGARLLAGEIRLSICAKAKRENKNTKIVSDTFFSITTKFKHLIKGQSHSIIGL